MRKRMTRLCVPALCTLLAAADVMPALAQARTGTDQPAGASDPGLSGHRRFLFSALGATIALVPALLMSRQQQEERGVCSSRTCTISVGAIMGASAGFLIGRDLDRSAAIRKAAGPSIRFPASPVELELVPEAVDAYDGGAIVIGREGLAMVGADRSVRRRGGAIRGVSDVVAFPGRDAVLAATSSGIFSFDLGSGDAEGRVVLREGGSTLEAIGDDQIVLGGGDVVRRLRLSGRGTLLELAEEARAQGDGFSTALAYAPQAGIVWALGRDRLVARTTQLEEVGSIALPAIGRSLSVSGGRALVAAGADGLFVVDVGQPSDPRLLGQVQGIGFAFDAVLKDHLAFVASGRNGLLVVDVSDPAAPRLLGAERNLGFVSSLALAPDGRIYVADREGERLFLVEPKLSGQGAPAVR